MGTRSTIKFFDEGTDSSLVTVYQQFDGHIDGVGLDLARFLESKKVVNGFSAGHTMELGYANGMGCLAAQFIAFAKTRIGGLYIVGGDAKESYNYEVRLKDSKFEIRVDDLFVGSPKELINKCSS